MSLCAETLARAAARGPFVRVLVAAIAGSAPREPGAEMLVWADGEAGTIGGGALEFAAIAAARARIGGAPGLQRMPLGPGLGQCCGGAVTLAYEPMDAALVARITGPLHARPLGKETEPPLAVARALRQARAEGVQPPRLIGEWLIEAVSPARQDLWIWGAGHVGRALVSVLSPLPGLRLFWVDTDRARFPSEIAADVTPMIAENPADLVPLAAPQARHLVLTFSHALDLELCHRLLRHGFGDLGLIGSATKSARFTTRLRALGHSDAQISRIACPIGDPTLGKHPQAIAVGVAVALLKDLNAAGAGGSFRESAAEKTAITKDYAG
jgi:xanthine dehydrogenase accessory factor